MKNTYHITCAAGLESALLLELAHLGIANAKPDSTGRVIAELHLAEFYRVCLWSRVASRVLLPLFSEPVKTQSGLEPDIAEQLYLAARDFDWSLVFSNTQTFVVRLSTDKAFKVNQQFATLRIKDAIVDSFVEATGSRPDVAKNAQHSVQVHVSKNKLGKHELAFYLDLTGTSLHRRGYRHAMTDAPLKENLAAALLYHTGWHSKRFNAIFDPMCGSGTLLIEALLMWTDYAVGSDKSFGFEHWQQHDADLWAELKQQAHGRHIAALAAPLPTLVGFDAELKAIQATHKNMMAAGFKGQLSEFTIEKRSLADWRSDVASPFKGKNTLIITNPPYGERLGDKDFVRALYQGLGLKLQTHFVGAQTAVVAAQIEDADTLPLADTDTVRTHNGQLTIYLRQGKLLPSEQDALILNWQKQPIDFADAQDLVNRLQKNLTNLKKRAKKQTQRDTVTNLRIYNADLPNYNLAVDVYGTWVHVQEYAAPKKIDEQTAKRNFNTALHAIRLVLDVPREQVFIKTRRKQKGSSQYEKRSDKGKFYVVNEAGVKLYVNLTDYLDTGLFLDHRPMRTRIGQEVRGKKVLNLYAYTCTASVHAALGGAWQVVSVDLSGNYLDWGKRNFALNGLVVDDYKYQFIEADVFTWLKNCTDKFDVIFIDPPTFSNSKKFGGTFDVQRDHGALIKRAMNRLEPSGVVYFSNNNQRFELDAELAEKFNVENITHETVGFDFQTKSNKKIHHAWRISSKSQQAQP